MSGKVIYLLDTNIVIDFLKGQHRIPEFIISLPPNSLAISQITKVEVLSHESVKGKTEKRILEFLDQMTIIPISNAIEEQTILFRRAKRLKIPDALIVSTALVHNITLITRDKQLLNLEIQGLLVKHPETE